MTEQNRKAHIHKSRLLTLLPLAVIHTTKGDALAGLKKMVFIVKMEMSHPLLDYHLYYT